MGSFNVCIVEDSKIISDIMKQIVGTIPNMKAITFNEGQAFLDHIDKNKPDLVLVDFYLDNSKHGFFNGEKLLLKVKKAFPDVPVVMMTGVQDKKMVERFERMGFDKIIYKSNDDFFKESIKTIQSFLHASA